VSATELHLMISFATVLGAGLSVYVGVRVALAEIRRDIAMICKDLERMDDRLNRLEDNYIRKERRGD
jgi:hypothetical protein